MSNKFGIPKDIELKIRKRDVKCVYCHRVMKAHPHRKGVSGDKTTIEHLNEDGPFFWKDGLKPEDIAICCGSCNSSRGKKTLPEWFQSMYCLTRKINLQHVSKPVRDYFKRKKLAY